VTTQHLVRGSYIHKFKNRLIFQQIMFLNAWFKLIDE
jgi:hypothetical protein